MSKSTFLIRLLLPGLAFAALALSGANALAAPLQQNNNWKYPVTQHKVSRPFEPPVQNWLAGHRGIDFPANDGDKVFAAGNGTVIYSGLLANKGVVVINHGLIRTTYEPLTSIVLVGDVVQAGELIGNVSTGISHCATEEKVWCLHWGAIRNGKYLNPLLLVNPRVRLLPLR